MSKFTRFLRLDRKSLASPDGQLAEIFGVRTTASGVRLSAEQSLCVPAVSAAVRVISEAAASLDILGEGVDAATLELLTGWANEWTSGYDLIRDLMIDALTRDVGGMAWVNRVNGRAMEIIRYRPGVIQVEYDQTTCEPRYKIEGRVEPASNIIHLRSPFGRCPLSMAREAIGVAFVLERHAARLFGRGARPGGILSFPKNMVEAAVKKARDAWSETHEGEDSGGKTAILYDGIEFKPTQLASTDAQFLENRKFQTIEIARAFRVPPSMLFELDRATWSNTEQMGREFLVYTLEPWLRALEAALARGLILPDERATKAIRFDRDDLTRADLSTRSTVINSLISSRVINPNEGRDWLGLKPRAGGDEFANPNITTSPADPAATVAQEEDDAAA